MKRQEWDSGQIWEGDCVELLAVLDEKSIDMILCDLPYGTTECKWDQKINLDLLWKQYKRIIKNNGVIVLTSSQPFTTELINSNQKHFKYEWVWVKNNCTGFQHAKNRPLKNHETVLIFSNGSMGHKGLLGSKRMAYNPQGIIKVDKMSRTSKNRFGSIIGNRPSHKEKYLTEFENYPKTVLYFNGEKGLHPTQKPVPLFEYLIRTYSNEGDIILDNCCGSGTTGIACLNAGRRFIMMEMMPDFVKKAITRITEHIKKLNSK